MQNHGNVCSTNRTSAILTVNLMGTRGAESAVL